MTYFLQQGLICHHLPTPPRYNQSIAEVRAFILPSPCISGPTGLGESLYHISLLVDTAHPNTVINPNTCFKSSSHSVAQVALELTK